MSDERRGSGITVVGAGVSGLTTAVRLAEAEFRVRVIARKFSPHTTSDVAPAVWYPFHVAPRERVVPWASVALAEFARLAAEEPESGVTMVEGIELFPERTPDPWWASVVGGIRRARADEIPQPFVDGLVFSVPVIAMNTYQPWLSRRAEALGIDCMTIKVKSLPSLFTWGPVVVNCAGLGARELVADVDLHPVRGQVVRVAPGYTKRFVQATSGPGPMAYIIPRPDCTVLGGTAEPDAWVLKSDPLVEEAIRARCAAIEPGLAAAPVIGRAIGLRPARSEIRLESEMSDGCVVVHNYGHGGAGVTVSWGCAAEVVSRVMDWSGAAE